MKEIVNYGGYSIALDPNITRENICIKICTKPNFFDIYNEVAKKFIKTGDKVCDVGSWIGFTSLNWINKGASKVYSFEPVKNFYQRILSINCDKIQSHNFALSDQNGEQQIYISSHEVGSTLDLKLKKHFKKLFTDNKTEMVTTKRLDDLNYDFKFNFIKINAEGSEENILKGGWNYLSNYTPDYIFIEFHLNFEEGNKLLQDLYRFRYGVNKKNKKLLYVLNDNKSNTNHYLYTNKLIWTQ